MFAGTRRYWALWWVRVTDSRAHCWLIPSYSILFHPIPVELHHFQQVVLLQVHPRGLGSPHSDHMQLGLGATVHQVVHSDVAICRAQHRALVGKDPGTDQQQSCGGLT